MHTKQLTNQVCLVLISTLNDSLSNENFALQTASFAVEPEEHLKDGPPDIQELKSRFSVCLGGERGQLLFVSIKVWLEDGQFLHFIEKMLHKSCFTGADLTLKQGYVGFQVAFLRL